MSENEAPFPLPNVPFAAPELLAITSVISGYVAYLQSLPSSPERERRITILVAMKDRFQKATASDDPQVLLLLKGEEVLELLDAMAGFMQQVKMTFPKSKKRDEVVNTVDSWLVRLVSIIYEHMNE